MYSALMIDLKKSRAYSIHNREAIQHYIHEVCHRLNKVFAKCLVRQVEFSAGDEIQGLFSSPIAAYLYFRLFHLLVHPVKIRAGIGVGSWDIQIANAGTTAQDGQVYYRARRAIQEADELEGYPILYCSDSSTDTAINSLISGATRLENEMNMYQNEIMLLAELLYPLDVDKMIRPYHLFALKEIVDYKRELEFYNIDRKKGKKYPFDSCLDYGYSELVSPVDIAEIKDTFYITSGRPRGLPSKLSHIMGITRQSIEKTLKAADIYVARNMAISGVKFMMDLQR